MCIKGLIRKMYVSILTCILILLTAITTTYAWFGMNNYINGSTFNLTINDSLGEDDLLISLDGVNFSHNISAIDAMRFNLENKGIDTSLVSDVDLINLFAENNGVDAITTNYSGNNISNFTTLTGDVSNRYLYMEMFVSVQTEDVYSDIDMNVYLDSNVVGGVNMRKYFLNYMDHPDFGILTEARISTKNFARIAIVKHDTVEQGIDFDAEGNIVTNSGILTSSDLYNNPRTTIYSPSSNIPSYDSTLDVYNFGGLNVDYNVAVEDYNKLHPFNKIDIPSDTYNRNDVVLDDINADLNIGNECNLIIDSSDHLRNGYMMKLGFYMWIEGWDPDCFGEAANQSISLTIALTTVNPYNI